MSGGWNPEIVPRQAEARNPGAQGLWARSGALIRPSPDQSQGWDVLRAPWQAPSEGEPCTGSPRGPAVAVQIWGLGPEARGESEDTSLSQRPLLPGVTSVPVAGLGLCRGDGCGPCVEHGWGVGTQLSPGKLIARRGALLPVSRTSLCDDPPGPAPVDLQQAACPQ